MNDFDDFYRTEYGNVLRTVTLALGDASRAEEATQEGFARALRRWRRVRTMERPGGWVAVVAINSDRKRWKSEERPSIWDAPAVVVDDHARAVVASVSLQAALGCLTVRQRAALVLRYLADLPMSEVAAGLGCAEGTAKATVHQALERLRINFGEDDR